MLNKKLHILLLMLFSLSLAKAGTVRDSIAVPSGSSFYTDNLRNVFVVSPTNDIIKYDPNGKKLAVANFKVLGNISSIDASNPFEIYVFYRDQNKILFLDNLLNSKGEIDLESLGVSQIACAARSYDNNIWLFDMADLKLKKIAKDGRFLLESASFNTFLSSNINPSQIFDNNTGIYLLNNGSILEFDVFGNFGSIKISDSISSFQCYNNRFYYLKNNKVFSYEPRSFSLKTMQIELPEKCKAIRFEKDLVYLLSDEFVILRAFLLD